MNPSVTTIFSCMVFLAASHCLAVASPIIIVKDQQIIQTLDATSNAKNPSKPLIVSGIGTFAAYPHLLQQDQPFSIHAKIALKLNGSAASLTINGNNIAFDGRDRQMFFEGADIGDGRLHYLTQNPIQSEIPFQLDARYDGSHLTVSIDSKHILKKKIRLTRPVSISLRPHRADLKIEDFQVHGEHVKAAQAQDILEKSPPRGPDIESYPISRDAVILCELPSEDWQAKIQINEQTYQNLPATYANGFLEISIPSQSLRLAYQNTGSPYNLRNVKITLENSKHQIIEHHILCFDPASCLGFRETSVKMIHGAPAVCVDGRNEGILRGRLDTLHHRYRQEDAIDFAQAGVTESEICLEPRLFDGQNGFQQQDFDEYIEKTCLRVAQNTPSNTIALRWLLYVSSDRGAMHADELIATDPRTDQFWHPRSLQPSYASESWRQFNLDILEKSLRKIRQSPFADRLTNIRIAYGNCGEWNNFGYHEKVFPDFSAPMQKAFGQWLKRKYVTNEQLQSAWQNQSVEFDSMNLIPTHDARMGISTGTFRMEPTGQQVSDYYAFWQDMTVQTIEYYARHIKQLTDSKLLVGAFYGYFVGHLTNSPYHFQDSGHYALGQFLQSPYLDYASGPYPYFHRLENACVNSVFSSFELHGKFWYSENDQATHLSGDSYKRYGTTGSLEESIALAKRDFMQNFAKGASYYFFDFVFGWYHDPGFMAVVKDLKTLDNLALKSDRHSRAEVAVLLDEEIIPRISNNSQRAMLRLRNMLGKEMDAAGAPWDCYLFSDMQRIDFSKYKLVLIANAYQLDQTKINAIQKYLYNSNRSVFYLHSPGLIGSANEYDDATAKAITGMNFQPAQSIDELDFQPLWVASGEDVQTIRKFRNGQTAIACRTFADYSTYFATTTGLDARTLHAMYQKTQVHCYAAPGDLLFARGNLIGVYSRQGGRKTITLPRKVDVVYDYFEKRVIAADTREFTLEMGTQPSCSIIHLGPLPQ